jgi:hypothetical protein
MSKAIIGDQFWAEMSEAQKIDAVLKGHATLTQMSEGVLDGSEALRRVCQESLAHLKPSLENLPVDYPHAPMIEVSTEPQQSIIEKPARPVRSKKRKISSPTRHRFGLPDDFVHRLQRYGRTKLLELNIYKLPDGREFVPSVPAGTLGTGHSYALLSVEQYLSRQRGSVYVRRDGRIFDYSVDTANPLNDFFDTGYTIFDLERTGQYAPQPRGRKGRRRATAKPRKVLAAGSGR